MAWKIYFFIFTLLVLLAYALIFSGTPNIWDYIDVFESTIALMGLFSYAFKKHLFPPAFWKYGLFIFIGWDITYSFVLSSFLEVAQQTDNSDSSSELIGQLIGWGVVIPAYFAIYKLGNPTKEQENF